MICFVFFFYIYIFEKTKLMTVVFLVQLQVRAAEDSLRNVLVSTSVYDQAISDSFFLLCRLYSRFLKLQRKKRNVNNYWYITYRNYIRVPMYDEIILWRRIIRIAITKALRKRRERVACNGSAWWGTHRQKWGTYPAGHRSRHWPQGAPWRTTLPDE